MIDIVLFEPEIPPNTGNIIRLTANAGTCLHLIHPLGFDINDKQLNRAGMDYKELTEVYEHNSFDDYLKNKSPNRIFAASTKGKTWYTEIEYQEGDSIVFGPETRGLPDHILNIAGRGGVLRIPMQTNNRSLNLSNAVSIILYEALRQNSFEGLN